jgi:hypothetical protein
LIDLIQSVTETVDTVDTVLENGRSGAPGAAPLGSTMAAGGASSDAILAASRAAGEEFS